jgi:peroxiredoxin
MKELLYYVRKIHFIYNRKSDRSIKRIHHLTTIHLLAAKVIITKLGHLSILIVFLFAQAKSYAQTVDVKLLLNKLDSVQQKISGFSYTAIRKDDYNSDGKITVMKALCAVKKASSDTLFGAKFRIQYNNQGSEVEYIYDLRNTYLVVHNERSILITNSAEYPAESKAKIAVLFLPNELIDTNVYLAYKSARAKVSINGHLNGDWVVLSQYPVSKDGSKKSKFLYIDSLSYQIKQIDEVILWNGVKYNTKLKIEQFNPAADFDESKEYLILKSPQFVSQAYKNDNPAPAMGFLERGTQAPDFAFKLENNSIKRLSSFRGKYLLLDFWEPWCSWCIEKFPELQRLYSTHQFNDFYLLALSSDMDARATRIFSNSDYTFVHGNIKPKVIADYCVGARPTYYLIDPTGKILLSGNSEIFDSVKKVLELNHYKK